MTRTSFAGEKDGYAAQLDIYPEGDYVVIDYADNKDSKMIWHVGRKAAFDMGKAIIKAAKALNRV